MRPVTRTITLAAASANNIAAAQTPGGAGAMLINGSAATGGVATLDAARCVLATSSSGTDDGVTVTLTGTDRNGGAIAELLTLNHTTAPYTAQNFLTVTGAAISAGTTGTVALGTNGIASTGWIFLSYQTNPFNVGYALNFGGVVATVQVEVTLDNPDKAAVDTAPGGCGDSSAAGLPYSTFVPPVPFPVGAPATTDTIGTVTAPCRAIRATVDSGAATIGVRFTVDQSGIFG